MTTVISSPLQAHAQGPQLASIEKMNGFPSAEPGIEKGVSACFAGTSGDFLLLAGGCNFPEAPAAEGGKKRYYRGIYAARITDGTTLEWAQVGLLPNDCAYGVTVQLDNSMLCIGGNNAEKSFAEVYQVWLEDGKAQVKQLPQLPVSMDNFTGSRCGSQVIVSNGSCLCVLNLDRTCEGWKLVPIANGAKLGQPVSGWAEGAFCMWGGSTAKTADRPATLHIEGSRFADLEAAPDTLPAPADCQGSAIFLGGAAAINLTDDCILAVGGVNKDVFLNAVNHPQPGYMTHPVEWYRFNPYVSIYCNGRWYTAGKTQVTARAGAALAKHAGHVYLIGGELKPGIRTPEIYRLTFK